MCLHPNKKSNGSCVLFVLLPRHDVHGYRQSLSQQILAEIPAPWHWDQKEARGSPALLGNAQK